LPLANRRTGRYDEPAMETIGFVEVRLPTPDGWLHVARGPAVGPPLMLLHGLLRGWRDFASLLPALAWRWHVHGIDWRGHGASDRAASYLVADYVRDVQTLLPQLTDEPAVFYGHSLGALVALALAAEEPTRVRAIVLEDPPSPRFQAELWQTPYGTLFREMQARAGSSASVAQLARELADVRLPKSDGEGTVRLGDVRDATSLRFSARCLKDVDPAVLTPVLADRWLEGCDFAGWLSRVRCPVLLLRGNVALGGMLAHADALQIIEQLPDATMIYYPNSGHLLHALEPELTLRHVVGFLESLR
jgi:pimeloyl-ACP methyl ester carboxylesterase